MEAVGLVLGVAGLFSTCLEAVEKVQSYHSFRPDSSTINTRFKTAKVLLEQWGRNVGFENGILLATHNEKLDDPDTVVAVKDVLNIIKGICQLGSQHRAANGANGSLIAGRRQKLKWAFGDKEKQQEQVELLERLVEQLRHLVSEHHLDPKVSQSHASIADIKSILSRIEKETRGKVQTKAIKQETNMTKAKFEKRYFCGLATGPPISVITIHYKRDMLKHAAGFMIEKPSRVG